MNVSATSPVGIIAGSGSLPDMLVRHCAGHRRPCYVVGFVGETPESLMQDVPHHWGQLDKVGDIIGFLRQHQVRDLVFVGRVARPQGKMRPDITTAKLMLQLMRTGRTGDDALLSGIVRFVETKGFTVRGVHEIMPEILAPLGTLGDVKPSVACVKDLQLAAQIAKKVGDLDIGQAVVVQGGRVIGVEAAEGTDGLIARIGELQLKGQPGGVLVKVRKPRQDTRIDLPAIGVRTIENIAAAGLQGVGVEAGHTLVIDREAVIARANALGVFVHGLHAMTG